MKIALGCDHRGWALKEQLKGYLRKSGYQVLDKGTNSAEMVDYPDFAFAVAQAVSKGRAARGILICATGIGMSIAANKLPGVRAALCLNQKMARLSREHNNANILCLGADLVNYPVAKEITRTFLKTGFTGGRHRQRLKKIAEQEKS